MSIITEAKATRRLAALLVMIMGLAMILPSNLAIASTEDDGSTDDGSEVQDDDSTDEGTTEDDGYIIGDDDSQGEVSSQEELEETYEDTPWEDNVGSNDFEEAQDRDDDDNDNDDEPKPYCDTPEGKAAKVCHDRKDYSDTTGLYPCNDGTQKVDWKDCKDATKKNDNDESKVVHKTTVIQSPSASASAIAAEVSSCMLDGTASGIQQIFDTAKYRACGLYPNGYLAYTDGFVAGCTQVGNTQQLCQAFVVMNTQSTQTATATQPITQSTTQPTQPTQTQPLTTSTQAIQPAAVS